jgi:hypothetical protein
MVFNKQASIINIGSGAGKGLDRDPNTASALESWRLKVGVLECYGGCESLGLVKKVILEP